MTSPELAMPPTEQTPDSLEVFKELLAHANGALIDLQKRTRDGQNLHIAVRRVENPHLSDSPTANVYSSFWDLDRISAGAIEAVLLVDTYASDDHQPPVSIGHMDWWINQTYANGGGNMHNTVKPTNPHEQTATDKWGDIWSSTAFKLDQEYHRQGIGSLMLAASGIALEGTGIKRFYCAALLKPAQKTYARFGLSPDQFVRANVDEERDDWQLGKFNLLDNSLPITRLTSSQFSDEVLAASVSTSPDEHVTTES